MRPRNQRQEEGDDSLQRAALGVILPGFAGAQLPGWLGERLDEGLAGVCLFADNITSLDQCAELTAAVKRHRPTAVIAIDEEGGDVTRLWRHAGGSPQVGNAVLGRIDDPDLTEKAAAALGTTLRDVGCTLNLAPVADINSTPDNPVIGPRSFGTDPARVARHVTSWVGGLQRTGVGACAKHFPGHGDTAVDSHHALPVIEADEAQLRRRELPPFAAAIAAGVGAVMTSHILLPALDEAEPATMSPAVLATLLRRQMGFEGLIVTDALDMAGASATRGMEAAAVDSLAAGADLLCLGTNNTAEQIAGISQAITTAVRGGQLSADRLHEAAWRVAHHGAQHRADHSPQRVKASEAQVVTTAQVRNSFTITSRGHELLDRGLTPLLVPLHTESHIAVGPGAWGPFALLNDGIKGPPVHDLGELGEHIDEGTLLVLIGRYNHQYPSSRQSIEAVRSRHEASLVVDMGWAHPPGGYADIGTYGAAPPVARALLDLLGEQTP